MDLIDNVTIFPVLSGLVTANLDAVLKEHKEHAHRLTIAVPSLEATAINI